MQIKQIAKDHIQVTVTEGDLIMFNININDLDPESPILREFLMKIMENVSTETGFDPHKGQVLVKARREMDRIVFSIMKIALTKEQKRIKYKNARPVIKKAVEKTYIYSFKDFECLSGAIKMLDDEILVSGTIYVYEDKYFCAFRTDKKFELYSSVLKEYSDGENRNPLTMAMLGEHGRIIAEGDNMTAFAEGIRKYDL